MQLIPVIDLKNGIAVHAVKGQREHYRPLQSCLSSSAQPMAVLQGLLQLHAFRCVYLADLDALTGAGENRAIIQQLLSAFPHLEFWIDQGWTDNNAAHLANHTPVLASESMTASRLNQLADRREPAILSLDFFGDTFVGPPELLNSPTLWPQRVILMTLAQVGSNAGPDWQRLDEYSRRYPKTLWIAAGGVRQVDDLQQLAQRGVHAVLLASALHNGALHRAALTAIADGDFST